MRWLTLGLYLFSALLLLIGVGLIYNLDSKRVKEMKADLDTTREIEEVIE